MVEITPSHVDKNWYVHTAIDAGSVNRLKNKYISPLQEVSHWLDISTRKVKGITMNVLCVITYHGKLYFRQRKKRSLLNWKEKDKGKWNKKEHRR